MVVLATSACLDVDEVLRIRWAEPPSGGTLTLRSDETELSVPCADGAADLSGLDLADGDWSVRAEGRDVETTDPGFSLDELSAYARRPRTRAVHAFRSPTGALRLRVQAVRPHAEVTIVHPGAERFVMEGFFAYGPPPDETEIIAVRRKTKELATGEVVVTGDGWRADLPIAPFAAETDRGFWDLRLGGLPVATLLDDIPQKKNKVRFPAEHLDRGADRVRVRAYYTDTDNLAIATTIVAEAS